MQKTKPIREIVAFILYWFEVIRLGLRGLKRCTCHLRLALSDPDHNVARTCNVGPAVEPEPEEEPPPPCDHPWEPTTNRERRNTGVYAKCPLCGALR